jgi:hypothetical protein
VNRLALRKRIIEAAKGSGHSVFSASGSPGWAFCADYLFANYGKPDNGNEDAAYGTVGHTVGEVWLNNIKETLRTRQFRRSVASQLALLDECEPIELEGTVQIVEGRGQDFHVTIDREMISYVREYVEWCFELPGDHYIETWVDYEDLMPIPGQGGTADHAACEPGRLTITDLKMGKGIQVFALKNTQLLLYAYGFFRMYDWLYDFQEIVIRICQPRREHFDVWTITRAELLEFAEWIKARAVLAWEGGSRSPGAKTCQWCKDVDCAARLAALHADTEDVFDDVTVIEGQFTVVGPQQMAVAKEALDIGWEPNPQDPETLSTFQLEKLLRLRKVIDKWMAQIESELESRANNGEELRLHKLVDGRKGNREFMSEDDALEFAKANDISPLLLYKTETLSPAQFEEVVRLQLGISKKKAANLIDPVTIRKPGRQTLAPISDRREEIEGLDDVFDDVSDNEGQ